MKRLAAASVALSLPLGLFAATLTANGKLETETRKPGAFEGVELRGVGELVLVPGSERSVVVELDSNLLPRYESKVVGGVLRLGFEEGLSVTGPVRPRIRVTTPALESLSIAGSAEARFAGQFSGKSLKVLLSGSGSFRGELDYRSLELRVNGSGDAQLSGRAADAELRIAGSGSVRAEGLRVDSARARIEGNGDILVTARSRLEAEISGMGKIAYRGSPSVSKRVAGMGSVERLGD